MEFISKNKKCPYLNGKISVTKYHAVDKCDAKKCKKYVMHGWRRFGKLFFTPICSGCNECKSMRVLAKHFTPTKNMKRVIKKNINTRTIIRQPSISQDHLALYDKYHQYMQNIRAWKNEKIDINDYYSSFVSGHGDFGYEFLYVIDKKLVGVALVDILPNAMSSIYCYYDHDYKEYSLGTFSILKQLEYAKIKNIDYLYLGYWVEDNDSLKYKSRFKPYEILTDGFDFGGKATWV